MASEKVKKIKEIRQRTRESLKACKDALEKTGSVEAAILFLQQHRADVKDKIFDRKIKEGIICSYIHNESRIGVLMHLGCETDFVARNQIFKDLAGDLLLQITASSPLYISRYEIPDDDLQAIMKIQYEKALADGKSEAVIQKIIQGRLDKIYREKCLLDQPFIKDEEITVEEHIKRQIKKLGENIKVMRFQRYEV